MSSDVQPTSNADSREHGVAYPMIMMIDVLTIAIFPLCHRQPTRFAGVQNVVAALHQAVISIFVMTDFCV